MIPATAETEVDATILEPAEAQATIKKEICLHHHLTTTITTAVAATEIEKATITETAELVLPQAATATPQPHTTTREAMTERETRR